MSFCSRVLLLGLGLALGCTKAPKVQVVGKLDMMERARKVEPSVDVILPKDINSGVRCKSDAGELVYGVGCQSAFLVKVGDIDLLAVEFDSEEHAQADALRLGQYYFANWLFDDVTGEPSLERFVKEAFGAVNPKASLPLEK